jgi:hypothetical protein
MSPHPHDDGPPKVCVDIRGPAEYDRYRDDPRACLHIVEGAYGVISGAARIDSVFAAASVASVGRDTRIDSVRGSAVITTLADTASVGRLCDSARIGYVVGSASVGAVRDSARIGSVTGSARVGVVEDWATIGRLGGHARIGAVLDTAHLGDVADHALVVHVAGSAGIGSVTDSAAIRFLGGCAHAGRVAGSARVEAHEQAVVHAFGGTVAAGPFVTVYRHDPAARIEGGRVVAAPDLGRADPIAWAAHAGVRVVGDRLVLFANVDPDLVSAGGYAFRVGAQVTAADRANESGPGLRLTAHPLAGARDVAAGPRRFLTCEVRVADVVGLDGATVEVRSCRVRHEFDPYADGTATADELGRPTDGRPTR